MAASRVTPIALRGAPHVVLGVLAIWAVLDFFAMRDSRWSFAFLIVILVGLTFIVLAAAVHWSSIRPIGLVAVGGAYVTAHAFLLGLDVVPALVFLTFLIAHVELRILAERFAPLYEASLGPSERARIRGALARAILRLGIATALAVAVPILAADLAVAAVVPATTIPTALLLAAALVVVVMILALLPSLERRAV
jgi:hypothetical protein